MKLIRPNNEISGKIVFENRCPTLIQNSEIVDENTEEILLVENDNQDFNGIKIKEISGQRIYQNFNVRKMTQPNDEIIEIPENVMFENRSPILIQNFSIFKCCICQQEFQTKGEVNIHLTSMHNEKKYNINTGDKFSEMFCLDHIGTYPSFCLLTLFDCYLRKIYFWK